MLSRKTSLGLLSILLSFTPILMGVVSADTSNDYTTSDTGVINVLASSTPLLMPCPADAPWLRDPNVCTQRWSVWANDKSESDLAVDPTNTQHLVGMSKFFFSPKDYLFRLGWYDSTDGGRTWTSGLLPGYDVWMDTTDPTVAFDSEGNLYALVLPFNFVIEPSGSHNWSVGHVSPKGINDGVFLSRSLKADGAVGRMWRTPVELALYRSSGVGRTGDKQWVGADIFGKHPGSVYASWIGFDGVASNVMFSVSTDHGASFSTPRIVSKSTLPKFNGDPYVFEGPEGNVYISYPTLPMKQGATTGTFRVIMSKDNGMSFNDPGQPVAASIGPTPYAPDTFRDGTAYTITVNPANGRLLMAFEDYDRSSLKGNIWLTESASEGRSWSDPRQINDPTALGDTFQPKIFAAQNGNYGVAFYDRRLACPPSDPAPSNVGKLNTCIDVTIQFYNMDGTPKGENRRVTQESWDPNINPPHPGGLFGSTTFIGDYFGGAMTSGPKGAEAHLLFVSTSPVFQEGSTANGGLTPPYQQQVYARVPAT